MPGRAASAAVLILSMNASSCSGSWWNRHSRPTPARIGKPDALLPARMAPADVRRQFLVGVGGVEDHERCILGQRQQRRIDRAIAQFDIGHIGDGLAAVLDPVADRAAGMIERCGSQGHAGPRIDHVAGAEVVEFELRVQRIDLQREERKAHQLAHRLLDAAGGLQAAGPDADELVLHEQRCEERQADHMVDVAVAQEDVEVGVVGRLNQCVAERADSGAGIEDQRVWAATDFHAGRVAAIAQCRAVRGRQCCPGRPKIEPKSRTPTSTLHSRPLTGFRIPPLKRCAAMRWRSVSDRVQPRSRRWASPWRSAT